jgi:hypothetical protein
LLRPKRIEQIAQETADRGGTARPAVLPARPVALAAVIVAIVIAVVVVSPVIAIIPIIPALVAAVPTIIATIVVGQNRGCGRDYQSHRRRHRLNQEERQNDKQARHGEGHGMSPSGHFPSFPLRLARKVIPWRMLCNEAVEA